MATTVGQRWRRKTLKLYQFDASQVEAVRLAAEALDIAALAAESIQADGLTVPGFKAPKTNPALAIRRDAVTEFTRLTRLLGIYNPEDVNAEA